MPIHFWEDFPKPSCAVSMKFTQILCNISSYLARAIFSQSDLNKPGVIFIGPKRGWKHPAPRCNIRFFVVKVLQQNDCNIMSHSSHPFTPYVSHPKKMISSNLKFGLTNLMPRKKTSNASSQGAWSIRTQQSHQTTWGFALAAFDMSPLWWKENISKTWNGQYICQIWGPCLHQKNQKEPNTHKSPDRHWSISETPRAEGFFRSWTFLAFAELQARPLKGMVALPPA